MDSVISQTEKGDTETQQLKKRKREPDWEEWGGRGVFMDAVF